MKEMCYMGMFLNRGNEEFNTVVNSDLYVDKTDMINFFNRIINTEQRYVCISRPRRFGKSITANMIAAYFEKGCDSRSLFEGRKLSETENWDKNLNKYDVIRIDLADIRSSNETPEETLDYIEKKIVEELDSAYPGIVDCQNDGIADALAEINDKVGAKFVIIIDEWDCLFRDDKSDAKVQERYVNLLRSLFKGNRSKKFTILAYITGILPIKKYNSESALNNFYEYTMTSPEPLAKYIGFTEDEVKSLCDKYDMDYNKVMEWYDGYSFEGAGHICGPNSVVKAMLSHKCNNYWSQTVAYNSLATYITMNFDGLRDAIVTMLSGQRIKIDTFSYNNDMTSFMDKDDVLTALIHLGYIAFDNETEEGYIPNYEVRQIFERSLKATGWNEVIKAVDNSERLLKLTLAGAEMEVAELLDECHTENTSILKYNDENSLASCIALAYYTARKDYTIIRELPAGYGFADMVFVPKPGVEKPAMIVELKWNKKAETAIDQIKNNKYLKALDGYKGEILLVGISYEKDGAEAKKHRCVIEHIK
jgi:predicted fused transcriptional regulator/phosphomethylpyrimidine kinase